MSDPKKITKIVVAMFLGLAAITAANRAYAQLGDWDTKTSMPTPRWGAVAGVIDGKRYVAGGWNGLFH